MGLPLENTPLSAETQSEVEKAARIFTNTLVRAAQETLPAGSPTERMQLIVTMGVQAVTTGAGRAFNDAAHSGLDAALYESMVLGMGTGVGTKLGVVDPFTREHALRVLWQGIHGGIQHGEAMTKTAADKAGIIKP